MNIMAETENDKAIKELANLLWQAKMRRKKVMLLAGCGLSKESGAPCLPSLFEKYLRNIERNEDAERIRREEGYFYQLIVELFSNGAMYTKEWSETIEWFSKAVEEAHPTKTHDIILQLWDEQYITSIVSLNYDNLIERACKEKWRDNWEKKCKIILNLEEGKNFLKAFSVQLPLIKAHGDLWMMQCRKCRKVRLVTRGIPFKYYKEERCECGESLHPFTLMPDSARKESQDFVKYFKGKKEEFDLVVCVGFSGRYDTHITDMLKDFKDSGVEIVNVNPNKTTLNFSDVLIGLEANKAFTKLQKYIDVIKKEYEAKKKDLELNHTFFDTIYKAINLTDIEWEICHSMGFRNLQGFHQLGLKYRKFISATHTRFEHSLGVMQVADEMYSSLHQIDENGKLKPDPDRHQSERQFLRLAALLHDIGHICFGHLGEETVNDFLSDVGYEFSHTEFAEDVLEHSNLEDLLEGKFLRRPPSYDELIKWIKDEKSASYSYYTYKDLIKLIKGESKIGILDKIVDSPFDADKLEYLLRDSKMTGRGYGIELDKEIFLSNLVARNGDLYIREEAISALERVVEARYHMYKEIYADPYVRGYETLFKWVLKEWIHHHEWIKTGNERDTKWIMKNLILDKNDSVIIKEINTKINSEGVKFFNDGLDEVNFLKIAMNIISGTKELPEPMVLKIRTEKSRKDIETKLRSLSSIENSFIYKVIIDTYFFDPIGGGRNEPKIITKNMKLKSVDELSSFIMALKNAYDYKIRVYLFDESIRENVVKEIDKKLEDTGVNIER